MTKREIENEILKELKAFMPKIKNVPFDRGLPLLRKEAWPVDLFGWTEHVETVVLMSRKDK